MRVHALMETRSFRPVEGADMAYSKTIDKLMQPEQRLGGSKNLARNSGGLVGQESRTSSHLQSEVMKVQNKTSRSPIAPTGIRMLALRACFHFVWEVGGAAE